MNSISEQTHGKKVTIVSISSTPGGEDAEPQGCERAVLSTHSSPSVHSQLQDGSFLQTHLTFPWESDSFLFKTGTEGTAELWSDLEERGVKKHT